MTFHKKVRGTKELEQSKRLRTKKEVTSNVAITEKNEKQSNHTARYTRAPRVFSDNVIFDNDGFTDESVVQCNV